MADWFRTKAGRMVLLAGLLLALGALGVFLILHRMAARDTPGMEAMAGVVGGKVDGGTVAGEYQGFAVKVVNHDGKKKQTGKIELNAPTGLLKLEVHPRAGAKPAPAELDLGDPAFKTAYVVEGGPQDTVQAVVSPSVRKRLLDSNGVMLRAGKGVITVHAPYMIVDAAQGRALLDLAVDAAHGVAAK